jgi:hypothetical protein
MRLGWRALGWSRRSFSRLLSKGRSGSAAAAAGASRSAFVCGTSSAGCPSIASASRRPTACETSLDAPDEDGLRWGSPARAGCRPGLKAVELRQLNRRPVGILYGRSLRADGLEPHDAVGSAARRSAPGRIRRGPPSTSLSPQLESESIREVVYHDARSRRAGATHRRTGGPPADDERFPGLLAWTADCAKAARAPPTLTCAL